jgi:hypothetical protein
MTAPNFTQPDNLTGDNLTGDRRDVHRSYIDKHHDYKSIIGRRPVYPPVSWRQGSYLF